MNNNEYQEFINKYIPKPQVLKNGVISFIGGGIMGLLGYIYQEKNQEY